MKELTKGLEELTEAFSSTARSPRYKEHLPAWLTGCRNFLNVGRARRAKELLRACNPGNQTTFSFGQANPKRQPITALLHLLSLVGRSLHGTSESGWFGHKTNPTIRHYLTAIQAHNSAETLMQQDPLPQQHAAGRDTN